MQIITWQFWDFEPGVKLLSPLRLHEGGGLLFAWVKGQSKEAEECFLHLIREHENENMVMCLCKDYKG